MIGSMGDKTRFDTRRIEEYDLISSFAKKHQN
jgi:hypothetical protein